MGLIEKAPSDARFTESNIRELWAVVQGNERVMQERDKRYEERNTANKEAVAAALQAAKEASEETKAGLKEYKASANEWRGTINDVLARGSGSGEGIRWIIATLVAVGALLIGLVSVAVSVFVFFAARSGGS